MAQTQDTIVTGTVEAVNERGVKLNGAWLNFGKFAEVARPEAGQTVAVTVRGDRWVQGLRVRTSDALDEPEGEAGPDFGEAAPVDDDPGTWGYRPGPGRGSAVPRPVRRAAPAPVAPRGGSGATLRAAALAAAAHYHSARPESTEDDLSATAIRLLAWQEEGD
jgi:hypothetical protein